MTVRILTGDCRDVLPTLAPRSVQCVVTSPPYFGLRDYGTAQLDGGDSDCDHKPIRTSRTDRPAGSLTGSTDYVAAQEPTYRDVCGKCGAVRVDRQMGLEPTLAEYITGMVDVFRLVRDVLADDGTVWLNIGDSYVGGANSGGSNQNDGGPAVRVSGLLPKRGAGLKPKDLMMVPARLAIALQDDGWYLRSDIIWHKPNPMPESVTDRPTSAHEHIFLLTKSARYYWDQDAIREPHTREWWGESVGPGYMTAQDGRNDGGKRQGNGDPSGRNCRNVWTLATQPYSGAHFATFPPEIPRRCILAGTSERGQCPACGAPWRRVVERDEQPKDRMSGKGWIASTEGIVLGRATEPNGGLSRATVNRPKTTGWTPQCECDAGDPVPQTVLDPFGGAGTTGMVADRLGRNAIMIELNDEYATLARNRIHNDAPMFTEVTT
jgi:DNA modification methylase